MAQDEEQDKFCKMAPLVRARRPKTEGCIQQAAWLMERGAARKVDVSPRQALTG